MIFLNLCRTIAANQRVLNQNPLLAQWTRTLFSEKLLRISDYETHRLRLDSFTFNPKKLQFELHKQNVDNVINITKQWIHKMDRQQCETDFLLLQNSLRFIHQNADPKMFYNFAPTVMRMLHYLNLPERALQLNYDLQLSEMFHQLSSIVVLCDMLFNNGMYKEVVQIIQKRFEELEKKNMRTSRQTNYLFFAACYKLNDTEYFNQAYALWKNCVKEHQFTQSLNFLSMSAINMDQPQIALETLPLNDKHFSSLNVRLLALSECGHLAKVEQLIKNILSHQEYKNYKISIEVMERIKNNVAKSSSTESIPNFDNYRNDLKLNKQLITASIDDILCWPMSEKLEKYDQSHNRTSRVQRT